MTKEKSYIKTNTVYFSVQWGGTIHKNLKFVSTLTFLFNKLLCYRASKGEVWLGNILTIVAASWVERLGLADRTKLLCSWVVFVCMDDIELVIGLIRTGIVWVGDGDAITSFIDDVDIPWWEYCIHIQYVVTIILANVDNVETPFNLDYLDTVPDKQVMTMNTMMK
jgi:hypothetical protein